MLQFCITAHDYQDEDALNRRLAVREKHFEVIQRLKASGNFIKGGAILNDENQMCGSVLFVQFETKKALDTYLEKEIYVTGKVWEKVSVLQVKLADL